MIEARFADGLTIKVGAPARELWLWFSQFRKLGRERNIAKLLERALQACPEHCPRTYKLLVAAELRLAEEIAADVNRRA